MAAAEDDRLWPNKAEVAVSVVQISSAWFGVNRSSILCLWLKVS